MIIGSNSNEALPDPKAIMLNIEWTADRKICIFQPIVSHPIAINIWHDAVSKTIAQWPIGKPLRLMQDFSLNKGFNLTRRLKMHLLPQFFGAPELMGRVAFLMQRTVGPEAVRLFYQLYTLSSLTCQVFYDKNEALAWLYAQSVTGLTHA